MLSLAALFIAIVVLAYLLRSQRHRHVSNREAAARLRAAHRAWSEEIERQTAEPSDREQDALEPAEEPGRKASGGSE